MKRFDGVSVTLDIRREERRNATRWMKLFAYGGPAIAGAVYAWLPFLGTVAGLASIGLLGLTATRYVNTEAPTAVGNRLLIDDEAIMVEGGGRRVRYDRVNVVQAHVEPPGRVRLIHHDGEALVIEGIADPQALLAELGLDVAHAAASFEIDAKPATRASSFRSWPILLFLLLGPLAMLTLFVLGIASAQMLQTPWAASGATLIVMLTLLAAGLGWGTQRLARHVSAREVRVGSDGIHVPGRGFVALDKIARCPDDLPLRLELHDGDTVPLTIASLGDGTPQENSETKSLRQRIHEAIAQRQSASPLRFDASALSIDDREPAQWAEDLRRRARDEGSYRSARWDAEGLAEAAADQALAPDMRIGAALAAAELGSGSVRKRIAETAGAYVDDDLRLALEEAAAGEINKRRLRRVLKKH